MTANIDFGVDNADKLLLVRAQEADVVAVMSPMQDSPRCIMVHKSSVLERVDLQVGIHPRWRSIPAVTAEFLTKKSIR